MITLETLGLGNVDNTSDLNKPVSTAQQAELGKLVSSSEFSLLHAIPGLPVRDVSMMFLPRLNFCDINAAGDVSKIRCPITGLELTQATESKKPRLSVDSNKHEYLRFNLDTIGNPALNGSVLWGNGGKQSSFMLIANTDENRSQTHFGWVKGQPGNYNVNKRYSIHVHNGNRIVVDSGGYPSKRIVHSPPTRPVGEITSYFYEHNDSVGKLYENGILSKTETDLSPGDSSSPGRFTIGAGVNTNLSDLSKMNFYGLIFYNRVLSDAERKKMFLFSKKVYGV